MPRTRIPPARRRRAVRCVAASQICTVNARRPSRALELALGLSWKICGCAQEGYRAARLCVCNTQKKPPAPQESPRRVEVAHTTQAVCFFGLSEPQIKLSAKVADGLRSISRKGHPRPLRRICCQIFKKVAPGHRRSCSTKANVSKTGVPCPLCTSQVTNESVRSAAAMS